MNQREAFEAWADSKGLDLDREGDSYYETEAHFSWSAWQAAQQTQWQPIETAPRDGTVVDIFSKEYGRLTDYSRKDLGNGKVFYEPEDEDYPLVRDVTHWMPLPPEPNP